MGNRRTAVWSKQPLHCLCRGWGHGGGKTDPDPGNSRKAGLERGRERQRAVVRPHNQTRSSCSSAHHHPVTKSSWWALWMEMHLTVDGRCIQAASPLVRVRTWDTPGPWGSFTFTSQSPGEHEVCLYLKSTRFALFYDGKLRREEHFRQTSKSTNQRVLWWSILQTLILVATGTWQMQRLKSFFKAKKLV
uniref:GOLD domain-containing protein n=1 Tax=Capra hircus TaxID=9925 RepID=A0A8C2NRZ3_CAPHI